MFWWSGVDDILELAQHPQYQDMTLVCSNGKMTCSSIVLALLSPPIRNALSCLPDNDKDEKITILFLDVDIEDIKQFFTNILNQTEEFSSCKAIVNLLGHTDIGVKIEK